PRTRSYFQASSRHRDSIGLICVLADDSLICLARFAVTEFLIALSHVNQRLRGDTPVISLRDLLILLDGAFEVAVDRLLLNGCLQQHFSVVLPLCRSKRGADEQARNSRCEQPVMNARSLVHTSFPPRHSLNIECSSLTRKLWRFRAISIHRSDIRFRER